MVPIHNWVGGYKFKQKSWAGSEILLHPLEICQGAVNTTGQRKSLAFSIAEGLLYVAEETPRAR